MIVKFLNVFFMQNTKYTKYTNNNLIKNWTIISLLINYLLISK